MKKVTTLFFTLFWLILSHAQIKVACVGNSVTYGYGLQNKETESYPSRLQELLGNDYQVGNFGHSGATLLTKGHRPYTEQEAYRKALDFKPDIVIIHLGLNDTDPRNWPNYRDEFITDYRNLINSFRKADGSQSEVMICRMTPIYNRHPRFKSGTREWFWQIQSAIEKVAEIEKVRLIDLHTPLYRYPQLFPDALHPNKTGAGIIAKTVYSAITGDFGGLKPDSVFGDNMVLQQKQPIPVYGVANRGDEITVRLNKQTQITKTDENGQWKVLFPPMDAGISCSIEIISSNKKFTFSNLITGDLWLASGQSNMEFPLIQSEGGREETENATNSNIRIMNYQGFAKTTDTSWDPVTLERINNLNYFEGRWQKCTPEAVKNLSAVAYHFAKETENKTSIPIGIIQMAAGGSPAEAWIDRKTLEHQPVLVDILNDWTKNDMIQGWCRQRALKNISNRTNPLQRHPYEPAYLYEAGISNLTDLPVKGVLWYQGESNAHNIELHEVIFPTLVESWRKAWENDRLPFYFVQLSSINRPSWPHFRNSQRLMAHRIPYCYMAVSSDKGNPADVHPTQKKEIGRRLALLALKETYGQKGIKAYGPEVEKAHQKGNRLTITFCNSKRLKTSDGEALRELEIADNTETYVPADAAIKRNKLIINRLNIRIIKIRYGWHPYSIGNLVNEADLPASTFDFSDIKHR